MDAKILEHSIQLSDRKNNLKRKLEIIDEEIQKNQNECDHVIVCMKTRDEFHHYGNLFCCLNCGQVISNVGNEPYINAKKYDVNYNDESSIEYLFEDIQIMTLGVLRTNGTMSKEELIEHMNKLINPELEKGNEKKLTRTHK